MDDNDLFATNQYLHVHDPDSLGISDEQRLEFQRYYQDQQLQSGVREDNRVMYSSTIPESPLNIAPRTSRVQTTYCSVDSRDRNKVLFPKPSRLKIFLGKTFYNVTKVRLASVEFPNTNAVINKTNNVIRWRNQQDVIDDVIDNITKEYPVYSAELRVGSYIINTLGTEMTNKLNAVKRENGIGDFHYFITTLDIDTDVVTFTGLTLVQLVNNPISVVSGLGLITVSAIAHGFSTGDTVYILGVKSIAGIPSTALVGAQIVTVLNVNTFQYEVNVKAGETVVGGGNTVKIGRQAPFQLLFGESPNSIAPNIGYPLENSSQLIKCFIKSVTTLVQLRINFVSRHSSIIGETVVIAGTGTTADGTRMITKIVSETSIVVTTNTSVPFAVYNTGSGTFTVTGTDIPISSLRNEDTECVLIETFTPHNYTNGDAQVTLYGTTTVPTLDSTHVMWSVISPLLFAIPGRLFTGFSVNVTVPGTAGYVPQHAPLATRVHRVENVTPGITTLFTAPGHGLLPGDKIRVYGLHSSPSVTDFYNGTHTVFSTPTVDTFTIDFQTVSVDSESIARGDVSIGYRTVTVTFPYHGFNTIVDIVSVTDLVDTAYNVEVTTALAHGLSDGSTIRLAGTNSIPSIDDGGYVVKVVSTDAFRIVFPGGITGSGTTGTMGLLSNDFYLYSATGVGGIDASGLNGIKWSVKNVVDRNTFTFDCSEYATNSSTGGGDAVYVSSLLHGFSGTQTNTKNSVLNRSINLSGLDYTFLCSPQLATMMNTGSVKDVFGRITLDQSPGSVVFNFLSNPKDFSNGPLNALNELEFSVVNHDGTEYEFNDLDYSFVLEISEIKDLVEGGDKSSRRAGNIVSPDSVV